jgi:hypothetical protein
VHQPLIWCVLCVQVLGDSFYDPAQERVPMSPALALETARVRGAAAATAIAAAAAAAAGATDRAPHQPCCM